MLIQHSHVIYSLKELVAVIISPLHIGYEVILSDCTVRENLQSLLHANTHSAV